jgi:hypothetical protein
MRWLRRHRRLTLGTSPAMPFFVAALHLSTQSAQSAQSGAQRTQSRSYCDLRSLSGGADRRAPCSGRGGNRLGQSGKDNAAAFSWKTVLRSMRAVSATLIGSVLTLTWMQRNRYINTYGDTFVNNTNATNLAHQILLYLLPYPDTYRDAPHHGEEATARLLDSSSSAGSS